MAIAALAASDGALLDAVRTIRWPARRRSPSGIAGTHVSRVFGVAPEFIEYRAYRPGDETRRIDWKLLARSNRAYIRLSDDRTVLSTMLLVDASASLAYPPDTLEKWHYARQLTLGLAAAAHTSGDPVGLVVAARDAPRRLPPRARRGVVYEIAHVLAGIEPGGNPALATLLETVRSTARVAVVSDFLGDSDALLRIAAQLTAAGREVHAVHVVHADESDPPRKTMLVADPENKALQRPLTGATRRLYLEAFGAWKEKLARDWRLAGAFYSEVPTTEPIPRAIRRLALPRAPERTARAH